MADFGIKQLILNTVDDMVSNLLYYDRKEDEDLPMDRIDKAVRDGEITEQEIVDKFAECLKKGLTRKGN